MPRCSRDFNNYYDRRHDINNNQPDIVDDLNHHRADRDNVDPADKQYDNDGDLDYDDDDPTDKLYEHDIVDDLKHNSAHDRDEYLVHHKYDDATDDGDEYIIHERHNSSDNVIDFSKFYDQCPHDVFRTNDDGTKVCRICAHPA